MTKEELEASIGPMVSNFLKDLLGPDYTIEDKTLLGNDAVVITRISDNVSKTITLPWVMADDEKASVLFVNVQFPDNNSGAKVQETFFVFKDKFLIATTVSNKIT